MIKKMKDSKKFKDIAILADQKLVDNDKYKDNSVIIHYNQGGYYAINLPNGSGTVGARGVDQLVKTLKAFKVHARHISSGYLLKPEMLLKIANA